MLATKYTRRESNTVENAGEFKDSGKGGAESGAPPASECQFDADLRLIVEAWPALPDAIKASILAMVTAADNGAEG